MSKPALHTQNAVQVFSEKSPKRINEDFTLIGAYGNPSSLSVLLTAYFERDVLVEDRQSEVKLLYSNSQSKAAMIYSNDQDFKYQERAIKSSNSVILFVRFLFDCCPVVYVCISDYHLENWYYCK